jgi:hypothetical protein
MKLIIYGNRELSAIKEEFSEFFPFLKIEFYAAGKQGPPMRVGLIPMQECRLRDHNGIIELSPAMTVSELEKRFAEYGFNVMVFIRSGKFWLDIFNKENLLYQENLLGEALNRV